MDDLKFMMNKFYQIFLLGLFISGCSKDTCKDVDRGAYIYPEKPDGITFHEAVEFYKIPEDIVRCMYTEELFQTCISYPEIRLFWTGVRGLQDGFDMVKGYCNGFEELLNRRDAYSVIVNAYKELKIEGDWSSWTDLEIGRYICNIINYEVFLAQNEILKSLTQAQKIDLINLTLNNLNLKFNLIKYYGYVGMGSSLAILSRIMVNDNYEPFMNEYANKEYLRIQILTMNIYDSDSFELITKFSEEYLKTLEN